MHYHATEAIVLWWVKEDERQTAPCLLFKITGALAIPYNFVKISGN
jgi:predicted secreted Zn-dependent protease